MAQTTPEVNPCSTCRYSYGFLCTHNSVGHSTHGGLNQVQSSYALHAEKMCGDSRRYYERKVQRVGRIENTTAKVTEVKPLVKSPFITRLINETIEG